MIELNTLGRPFYDQFEDAVGVLEWMAEQKHRNEEERIVLGHIRDLVEEEARR